MFCICPEFVEQIINLGKRYCQDSVIIVPKGEEAYIYGTNKGEYPGLDQQETLGKFMGGKTGEFMSRISGRPFVMKEDEETKTYEDLPGKQRQAAKLIAQRVDREINEMHMVYNLNEADLPAYDNNGKVTLYHYAPVKDDKIEIEIKESDLRIDTYRASGAGGQHVNKTDSAVRITHLPTNIVVQCQSDRSQHKNRSNAMKMIKSRIYETELQKRKEDENIKNKEKKDIGWGNQIRSYVLHPYKLIKDLRSGYETSNVNDVLDGKIDDFLENSLTI